MLENESLTGGLFGGPAETINGALLFKQTDTPLAPGLTPVQLSGINRVSNLADTNNKVRSGVASEFTSTNAIYVNAIDPANLPLASTQDFKYLRLSAVAPTTLQTNVGGFDLQWGLWQDPTGSSLKVAEYRSV